MVVTRKRGQRRCYWGLNRHTSCRLEGKERLLFWNWGVGYYCSEHAEKVRAYQRGADRA